MKKKWPGTLLIIALFLLVVLVMPLALFSTISGTFAPPAPGTEAAQIPELPYSSAEVAANLSDSASDEKDAGDDVSEPVDDLDVGEMAVDSILEDAMVKHLVAAYRERHPVPSAASGRLHTREGVPLELCEMALAMLEDGEPSRAFLSLLGHPDGAVRYAAIYGLLAAQNALGERGTPAMIGLLAATGEADRERLVRAAVEALIADTEAGRSSNAQMLLMYLGDYALPAIPHLVWASRNHTDPNTRVYAMSVVFILDPGSDVTRSLISERLVDANGGVRLQALQAWALRPLRQYAHESGRDSPLYLERRPGNGPEYPDIEEGAPVQKSALARSA